MPSNPTIQNIDNTYVEAKNVVNIIDQPKPKRKSKLEPCITFDPKDIIKAPDGPLRLMVSSLREYLLTLCVW